MARSLADPLYERLLNSFPATEAYTRADCTNDEMPDPVAHFLTQLLNHHSRREARRLRRARTEWVNYEHPDMEQAVRTFFEAVKAHTRVPADEWASALRRATRHATAHLVRPVHVLSDFVYAEQQEPLPISKVLWRMNFFGPYAYLRKAVRAFADKHDLDTLGPDRFDRFLHRVDERITSDYDADRWLRLLDPLFSIAHRGTGRKRVPPALLQAFFEEKGRLHIEEQLERYADDGHDGVDPRTLHRLIEAAESDAAPDGSGVPSEAPARSAPASPQEGADTADEADDSVWNVDADAGSEAPDQEQRLENDDSAPLWQRFQQGRSATSSDETASSAASKPPPSNSSRGGPSASEDNDQQPLWARFQHERNERLSEAVANDSTAPDPDDAPDAPPSSTSEADAPAPSPSPSGSSPSPNSSSASAPSSSFSSSSDEAASPSQSPTGSAPSDLDTLEQQALGTSNPPHRAVYVRQLFEGDRSDYQQVLRRLADADSWGEASQIIASDVFRKHKVNIYSDAAVHFTNTVEDRFRNE